VTAWALTAYGRDTGLPESLRRYVLSTWQRSARSGRLEHDPVVSHQLLCSSVAVLLTAEHPEVPGRVAGWLLATPTAPPIVHYAYTRSTHRRSGCARALLAAVGQSLPVSRLYTTYAGRLPRPIRGVVGDVVVETPEGHYSR
jgi:hypothetical protein